MIQTIWLPPGWDQKKTRLCIEGHDWRRLRGKPRIYRCTACKARGREVKDDDDEAA